MKEIFLVIILLTLIGGYIKKINEIISGSGKVVEINFEYVEVYYREVVKYNLNDFDKANELNSKFETSIKN